MAEITVESRGFRIIPWGGVVVLAVLCAFGIFNGYAFNRDDVGRGLLFGGLTDILGGSMVALLLLNATVTRIRLSDRGVEFVKPLGRGLVPWELISAPTRSPGTGAMYTVAAVDSETGRRRTFTITSEQGAAILSHPRFAPKARPPTPDRA